MLKRIIFLAFFILLITQISTAASYIAVTEPELNDAVVAVYGTNLVVGQGHQVSIGDGDTMQVLVDNLPGQVSAVTLGDVNGDLRDDLVIGTGTGGALYIYTEREGTWERYGQTLYLWDTISSLKVHDLNSDGWGDVLLITQKGEAHVLLSMEGTLTPLWRSPSDEVVVGLEVVDVDHNGYPDLIYALQSGYLAVLSWDDDNGLSVFWENYPWGSVESLVVLPHASSPEWLVITSQKMLYGWRWRNGEVFSSRQFEANALGEHLYYYPEEGLLSLSKTTGISLFELHSSSVKEKWRVPGLFGNEVFYYQGEFFFRDHNRHFSRLVQGSTRWRLFVHDKEVTDSVRVVTSGERFYFNLEDLVEVLGLTTDPNSNWCFTVAGAELEFYQHSAVARYGDLLIPLTNPVLEADGHPYITLDVLSLFGWETAVDLTRQHVVFGKIWGWWL
ncbi:MAG: VCBS repeat-containing protein [Firmicutes bacterium]|nr:VCBS repeat-containing protein [Bacillota bacterium]